MKVSKIKIENILGIEELEIAPGAVTVISGGNGTGKTSALEAVKAALRGGNDATLLRNGAKKGEVVLVLDDGTAVKRTVRATGTTTKVCAADGAELNGPAGRIKAIVHGESLNPVEWISAPKASRVEMLAESIPMDLDVEKIGQICGREVDVSAKRPLDLLDALRKEAYDERTGLSRAAREKAATAKQLSDAVAPVQENAADVAELEKRRAAAEEKYAAEMRRIEGKLEGVRKDYAGRIAALRDELAKIEHSAEKSRSMAGEERAASVSGLDAEIRAAREAEASAARASQARETAKKMREEADELERRADGKTAEIEALDAYRMELLAKSPLPGLEIREGDIFVDGVPFDRVNSARKMRIAVEVAKLRAGELGLICVDGAEMLDEEAFAALCEGMRDSGLQMICTRVSAGPINVRREA